MSINVENARAIAGAIYWEELDFLATQAQSAKIAIELGSWAGKSSRAIADNLPEGGVLYCVDTWAGSQAEMDNPDHPEGQVARLMDGDYVYDDFCRNMWDLIQNKTVKPIRMHGKHAAALFANQGLQADFIFIDGGHGKGEVKADIEWYYPLLKSGGILCGHDYKGPGGLWPDVGIEVDERFGSDIITPPGTMIWAHHKQAVKKTYIQLGAGAGDLDPRSNFKDGFTEYVKKQDKAEIGRIILVEPNPANIPYLQKCWGAYPQAEILELGIRPNSDPEKTKVFYFAQEDAPHYQVFSMLESHVKKHYPESIIFQLSATTLTTSEFFSTVVGQDEIELLAMDLEGIDSEILFELDWALPIKFVSFEYIHLKEKLEEITRLLRKNGYENSSWLLDDKNYDVMFEKV